MEPINNDQINNEQVNVDKEEINDTTPASEGTSDVTIEDVPEECTSEEGTPERSPEGTPRGGSGNNSGNNSGDEKSDDKPNDESSSSGKESDEESKCGKHPDGCTCGLQAAKFLGNLFSVLNSVKFGASLSSKFYKKLKELPQVASKTPDEITGYLKSLKQLLDNFREWHVKWPQCNLDRICVDLRPFQDNMEMMLRLREIITEPWLGCIVNISAPVPPPRVGDDGLDKPWSAVEVDNLRKETVELRCDRLLHLTEFCKNIRAYGDTHVLLQLVEREPDGRKTIARKLDFFNDSNLFTSSCRERTRLSQLVPSMGKLNVIHKHTDEVGAVTDAHTTLFERNKDQYDDSDASDNEPDEDDSDEDEDNSDEDDSDEEEDEKAKDIICKNCGEKCDANHDCNPYDLEFSSSDEHDDEEGAGVDKETKEGKETDVQQPSASTNAFSLLAALLNE